MLQVDPFMVLVAVASFSCCVMSLMYLQVKVRYDQAHSNNEYEDMEDDGLLVHMLFVYITMNICVIDSYHMPCIVKGIEKLTQKVKNVQQQMNEQRNAPGDIPTGMLKCQS
jgi:hypothetical protein